MSRHKTTPEMTLNTQRSQAPLRGASKWWRNGRERQKDVGTNKSSRLFPQSFPIHVNICSSRWLYVKNEIQSFSQRRSDTHSDAKAFSRLALPKELDLHSESRQLLVSRVSQVCNRQPTEEVPMEPSDKQSQTLDLQSLPKDVPPSQTMLYPRLYFRQCCRWLPGPRHGLFASQYGQQGVQLCKVHSLNPQHLLVSPPRFSRATNSHTSGYLTECYQGFLISHRNILSCHFQGGHIKM